MPLLDNPVKVLKTYLETLLHDKSFDPPVSVYHKLEDLYTACVELLELADSTSNAPATPEAEERTITISCDSSIQRNPGGPASIAFCVRNPAVAKPLVIARPTNAVTNNQAEYDAVYEGLSYVQMFAAPMSIRRIKVVTDSQLVVKQINGDIETVDESLKKKRDIIRDLMKQISRYDCVVSVQWMPRNSTPDLKEANYAAQDVLGVKRH